MRKRVKVLFIQHAAAVSGAARSLLYLMEGLERSDYQAVPALIRPSRELRDFYESAGFPTIDAPGITTFEHTTASWGRLSRPLAIVSILRSIVGWRASMAATRRLVTATAPDIVHLNSVVLQSSAEALACQRVPAVWHVRESPVAGYYGKRKAFMVKRLLSACNELIFLSNWDKASWVGDRRGVVVRNFVDLEQFERMGREKISDSLSQMTQNSRVILYVGGVSELKGIRVLLKALAIVRDKVPNIKCIAPASTLASSGKLTSRVARAILPLVGCGVLAQEVEDLIRSLRLESVFCMLPTVAQIAPLFALSEVVVFPALEPHFARPILESGVMKKPSIASDIGGMRELVDDGKTGMLVKPGDHWDLAAALLRLLNEPVLAASLGRAAYEKVGREFNAPDKIQAVVRIYESILGRSHVG